VIALAATVDWSSAIPQNQTGIEGFRFFRDPRFDELLAGCDAALYIFGKDFTSFPEKQFL
jgi:hypothetical protein